MKWKQYDADKVNPDTLDEIMQVAEEMLTAENKINDKQVVALDIIKDYESGNRQDLNKVIGVNIFRPSEFDEISTNDKSLETIQNWFLHQSINWNNGSKTVQYAIDKKFKPAGDKVISGGREKVVLDNLVMVDNRKVAIEIETSIYMDNGFWTLRQAIKNDRANYGVMIVPWFALGGGRANEGKVLGRLDREFEGKTDLNEGPIYRFSPIRKIDFFNHLVKVNKQYYT